jgi:hypothetical protein
VANGASGARAGAAKPRNSTGGKAAGAKSAASKSAAAKGAGANGSAAKSAATKSTGAAYADGAAPKRRARAAAGSQQEAQRAQQLPPEAAEAAAGSAKGARIEIKGIIFTAIGILMMVAFFSNNAAGAFGSYVKAFVFGLFGQPAYFVPSAIIIAGVLTLLSNKGGRIFGKTFLCTFMLFAIVSALMHTAYYDPEAFRNLNPFVSLMRFYFDAQRLDGGGFVGGLLAMPFITVFQVLGSRILLGALLLIDIILLTNISVASFLRKAAKTAGRGVRSIQGHGWGRSGAEQRGAGDVDSGAAGAIAGDAAGGGDGSSLESADAFAGAGGGRKGRAGKTPRARHGALPAQ